MRTPLRRQTLRLAEGTKLHGGVLWRFSVRSLAAQAECLSMTIGSPTRAEQPVPAAVAVSKCPRWKLSPEQISRQKKTRLSMVCSQRDNERATVVVTLLHELIDCISSPTRSRLRIEYLVFCHCDVLFKIRAIKLMHVSIKLPPDALRAPPNMQVPAAHTRSTRRSLRPAAQPSALPCFSPSHHDPVSLG
jgi:hypothetical protein